jgi:hypothetical protein
MQRIWKAAQVVIYDEISARFFVCVSMALVPTVAVLVGLPVWFRPKETIDLLNSWTQISERVKSIDPTAKSHPLDNWSACLKTTANALDGQAIVVGMAAASLSISNLHVGYFTLAKDLGLVPDGMLPNWAWRIMFAPLEGLTTVPFMLISPLSANLFFMSIGALDIYLRQLR